MELALPQTNDSLYEQNIAIPNETWLEKVKRKLQFVIPDHGTWGETIDNFQVFVKGTDVKTTKFKMARGMLEYTVGMSGKIVEEVANDTNTRITVLKPMAGTKVVKFTITGITKDVDAAQYIFQKIVKSNIHKLTQVKQLDKEGFSL